MNSDDFKEALASELPSARMRAAQWAVEGLLNSEHERLLIDAVARESVPRIRVVLSNALKQFTRTAAEAPEYSTGESRENHMVEVLEDLSGIISHEMQPVIGWVRFAANKELPDFEVSATNRALEALRRRVDGLAALAAAHRVPVRKIVSLAEVLSSSRSMEHPTSMFTLDQADHPSDDILTDPGLLSLILTNAIQNAVYAVRELPSQEGQVHISTNVNETMFWLTVSNRFTGTSFEYSNVSASGRTSKHGHRGLGTKIIELASERLGYEFDLRAVGSTVTFSLRGNRFG